MKYMVFLLAMILSFSIFSQELIFKVVEKKGIVDIRERSGNWKSIEEGDSLITGTEIFTGLHAHISLEIGPDSYITVKQLSHLIIDRVRMKKDEINTEVFLNNGYLVVLSKNVDNLKNRILVSFFEGNVQFDGSGGEVYLRKGKGVIIKSFEGKIKVRSMLKNKYFIKKGEVCGIAGDGKLVEADYFLRKGITNLPLEYQEEAEIINYYNQLLNYYTTDKDKNDYGIGFGISD